MLIVMAAALVQAQMRTGPTRVKSDPAYKTPITLPEQDNAGSQELPDVMVMNDGTDVTRAQWQSAAKR